jgi:hypothetical protein
MLTTNWTDTIYGDEVAILPFIDSPATEVLGIQTVEDIGSAFIQLSDGKVFTRAGGVSLDGNTCIVPATEQHRVVLKGKGQVTRSTPVPAGVAARA